MKKILSAILLILALGTCIHGQDVVTTDSLTREQFVRSQTVKADTLNMMALQLATPAAGKEDLNKAIDLIMKGLHVYSRYRDSIGLRETFDHLALVYHLQKKYIQAKWFYIQSNTLSHELKDTANIIKSLISLSTVKADMKDATLAEGDLQQALSLAKTQVGIDPQIDVENAFIDFYTKKGSSKKAMLATNRISFLKDSVLKVIEDQKLAQLKQQSDTVKATVQQRPVIQAKNSYSIIVISAIAVVILLLLIFYLKRRRN